MQKQKKEGVSISILRAFNLSDGWRIWRPSLPIPFVDTVDGHPFVPLSIREWFYFACYRSRWFYAENSTNPGSYDEEKSDFGTISNCKCCYWKDSRRNNIPINVVLQLASNNKSKHVSKMLCPHRVATTFRVTDQYLDYVLCTSKYVIILKKGK